ncbi:MAG: hypothetical protein HOM25_00355 [Rhodospirillaceae bacterium]|jgi:hypothetical protein|nr:hypothetical protein [Rhodospirillaceae bacterium]
MSGSFKSNVELALCARPRRRPVLDDFYPRHDRRHDTKRSWNCDIKDASSPKFDTDRTLIGQFSPFLGDARLVTTFNSGIVGFFKVPKVATMFPEHAASGQPINPQIDRKSYGVINKNPSQKAPKRKIAGLTFNRNDQIVDFYSDVRTQHQDRGGDCHDITTVFFRAFLEDIQRHFGIGPQPMGVRQ